MKLIIELPSFGMLMNERSFSSPAYRWGFNGQEKDDEIFGESNSVSFTHRIADVRLGRFFERDQASNKLSYNSPYNFAENKVIQGKEYNGLWVLLIGFQESRGAIGKSSVESGFILSSSGQVGFYASSAAGLVTNIGISGGVSFTWFGEMTNIYDAAGSGQCYSVSAGEDLSGSLGRVVSGKYEGVNVQANSSWSFIPADYSYTESQTKIFPINQAAMDASKSFALKNARGILNDDINRESDILSKKESEFIDINHQISELTYDTKILEINLNEKLSNSKSGNSFDTEIMKATLTQNNAKIDQLNKTLNACYEDISKIRTDMKAKQEAVNVINKIVPR